ncbi:transmembrane protein 88-like isoform X2 [Syngnathoides biaculeatus]|uniref:transmembrane protein 88-like isoform X2 n=1 Tax=Syngnathoides biaculeatus TaxID=300417 RepID=UPI002ADDDF69|nr:transmembrane protein 88-like isoform X2 [Syngnathoides biaculeatus]
MSRSAVPEKGVRHQVLDLPASAPAAGRGGEMPSRASVPPPHSAPELRGSLDCWACSVLVTAQNLVVAAVNACLAGLLFGSILTPAVVMVAFGFLCHSSVRLQGTRPYCSAVLTDGGCVALLVVGFLLVTPFLVLALAAYCRLARHLRLGLCFIPYSRAVYKNPPAARRCCGGRDGASGGAEGKTRSQSLLTMT